MDRKPKLQTVALEAGVSTATVSQVLRGIGRISDETREKVLTAARKVNYQRDGRAASMRSGEIREIGLVVHHLANPFNAEVISGVSDRLDQDGYLVSVLDSRDDPERQQRNLQSLIQSTRGGLLWVPAMGTTQATLDLLAAHRVPTVTFLRRANTGGFDHVGLRNSEALRLAVCHLADLGHRHIAFLGGRTTVDPRAARIAGYKEALAERGLAAPIIWSSADSKAAGLEAAIALRQAHPELTALVCNGDMIALGACLGLARMGLSPGREISVVGFDDIDDAALATPALTTLSVQPYDLGRRLAELLLARIADPNGPAVEVELAATLTIRDTTGPPISG